MTSALTEQTLAASAGEDDVSQYMREIRRFPVLTPQQERELARLCSQGDENAIRQMVNCNLRLVVSVAREYAGRGVPLMDLIQEGSMGLWQNLSRYDGGDFEAFRDWQICQSMSYIVTLCRTPVSLFL